MRQRGTDLVDRLISFLGLANTIPEAKRQVFLFIQSIGILVLLTGIALAPLFTFDWFNFVANLVMLAFLTTMTLWLWRWRERQELLIFIIFVGSSAWVLVVMLYNVLNGPLDIGTVGLMPVVAPWLLWIVLLYMVCFLTFRAFFAMRMALTIGVVFTTCMIFFLTRVETIRADILYDFVVLFAANVFVLILAYPLAQAQEHISQTDFLTGLANRNRGYQLLTSEIQRAQRYEQAFAVILFDVDHFKKINDTCGHPCGDAVLREVAGFANEHIRRTDVLCRWGGEEFLLIMTQADLASARLKADHMRQQLKNRPFYKSIRLTASFGVTAYYPYDSANSILERADAALYRAKRNGRNCVEVE